MPNPPRGEEVPWLIAQVVLRGPHLVLADVGGDDRSAAGHRVQLSENLLRLQRAILAVLKRKLLFPLAYLVKPLGVVGWLYLGQDGIEDAFGVADNRHIRRLGFADLCRVDIDVDDLGVGGERLQLSGHAVIEARADSDEQVAMMHRVVGVGRAVHPQHPQREGVRLGEGALAHQRRGGGDGEPLGELAHFFVAPGVDGSAAHVEDRARGCVQELRRAGDLHGMPLGGRPVTADLCRALGGRVLEIATGDVPGQVNHHGAGPAGRGDMERLVDHPREIARVLDQVVMLHHGERDAKGVCLLEGVLANVKGGHLAGERHNRDGVHVGVGDSGDQVGGSGTGGADAYSDAPGRARVTIRHMGAALFVARQNVADG